jgi:DNA-binding transcriptional regulator YdaS (Cro superfamily)
MDLKSWLAEKHGRAMALSRFIDVPPSFVSKMARGEKAIPAEHCRAIVDFTDGQVTVQEMRTDWYKYWPELAVAPASSAQAATQTIATQGA